MTSYPKHQTARSSLGWHVLGAVLAAAWIGFLFPSMFTGSENPDARLEDLAMTADFTAGLQPRENWMGMYLQEAKLGMVHTVVRPGPEGLELGQRFLLAVLVQGDKKIVKADVRVHLTGASELKSFEVVADTGFLDIKMQGRMAGGRLDVDMTIGGSTTRHSLKMKQSPVVSILLPALLARQDLQPGRRYRLWLFDPMSFTNSPVVVEMVGIEPMEAGGGLVPAYHVRRRFMGQVVDSWIDGQGDILKEEYAQWGLSLRREDASKAQSAPAGVDLLGDREQVMTWLQSLVGGRGTEVP